MNERCKLGTKEANESECNDDESVSTHCLLSRASITYILTSISKRSGPRPLKQPYPRSRALARTQTLSVSGHGPELTEPRPEKASFISQALRQEWRMSRERPLESTGMGV